MRPVVAANGVTLYPDGSPDANEFAVGDVITLTATLEAGWTASGVTMINRPAGSASTLSSTVSLPSTFTVDESGTYRIRVVATGPVGQTSVTLALLVVRTPVRALDLFDLTDTELSETTRTKLNAIARAVDTLSPSVHLVGGDDVDGGPKVVQLLKDACNPTNGFRIVELPGDRVIRTTIGVYDHNDGGNVRRVTLRGTGGANGSARLLWGGADGGTVIDFRSQHSAIENLVIAPTEGKRIGRAINITEAFGTGSQVTHHNTLRNLLLTGRRQTDIDPTPGNEGMDYGLVIGDRVDGANSKYPYNVSENRYERVHFQDATIAHVWCPNIFEAQYSSGGQVKSQAFVQCNFESGPRAIYVDGGMGFGCHEHCSFGSITTTVIHVATVIDTLPLRDCYVEACAQFLTTGQSSNPYIVDIDGGYYNAATGLTSNGRYIDYKQAGPLMLRGALFVAPDATNWHIYLNPSNSSGITLDAHGVVFPRRSGDDDTGLVLVQGSGSGWYTRKSCRRVTNGNPASVRLAPLEDVEIVAT
jgi:hypothetical protein